MPNRMIWQNYSSTPQMRMPAASLLEHVIKNTTQPLGFSTQQLFEDSLLPCKNVHGMLKYLHNIATAKRGAEISIRLFATLDATKRSHTNPETKLRQHGSVGEEKET